MIISEEQKIQLGDIFEELSSELDITKAQYDSAVESYTAVGKLLAEKDSPLAPYAPEILPQGSFLFGTVIKPIDDDLDIDLVCQLSGKNESWTQFDLKQKVGSVLKGSPKYEKLIDKEGRRCWTLKYADSRKFHLDILPSIVSKDYQVILEKSLRSYEFGEIDDLAIRITDRELDNYDSEENPDEWPKSNPFGYAKWFQDRANLLIKKSMLVFEERLQPVPNYEREKLPLLRVVQLLKRHRDIMFEDRENKPISIIITTLAGKAYDKEENLMEAITSVVTKMRTFIAEKYDDKYGKIIKWISNPVNEEENFADKWPDEPEKEDNFFEWLEKLENDINNTLAQTGGLIKVAEQLYEPFGENVVEEAFKRYGDRNRQLTESGKQKMAYGTGMLGETGKQVKKHNFYGKEEKK